jgi:hypothetical protein
MLGVSASSESRRSGADSRCRVATPESNALPDSTTLSGLCTGGHGPKPRTIIAQQFACRPTSLRHPNKKHQTQPHRSLNLLARVLQLVLISLGRLAVLRSRRQKRGAHAELSKLLESCETGPEQRVGRAQDSMARRG